MKKKSKIKTKNSRGRISYAISVSVYWADSWKSIFITEANWKKICSGKSYSKRGESYNYEGIIYKTTWYFYDGLAGFVSVEYGGGGDGFSGTLSGNKNVEIVDFRK